MPDELRIRRPNHRRGAWEVAARGGKARERQAHLGHLHVGRGVGLGPPHEPESRHKWLSAVLFHVGQQVRLPLF